MWEVEDEQINMNDLTLVCNVKHKKKLQKKMILFTPVLNIQSKSEK